MMFARFVNYLHVALRNIRKNALYSMIIISGLVIGLTFFILGVLYVNYHFNFDKFQKDLDRIYLLTRVITSSNVKDRNSFYVHCPAYPLLKEHFPEIDEALRFIPLGRNALRWKDKTLFEDKIYAVDDNFFTFFSLKLQQGNATEVLREPNSVVLTASTARKYFGDEDPLGKTLDLVSAGRPLKVTGITEDLPLNSSLDYTLLVSASTYQWLNNWEARTLLFVKLKKDSPIESVNSRLPGFTLKYAPVYAKNNERLYLFPFKDLHFRSIDFLSPLGDKVESPVQFYFIIGVSVFLLLIVCINFMNLSTARYMNRAKEVGLRKTLGASRNQLILQFLGESILLALIALPLSILFFEILKPVFLSLIGRNIRLSLFQNPFMLILILGVTLLVGFFSGSYPALFLSRFKPIEVLKGKISTGIKGAPLRKILVVTQFLLSLVLIIPTLVIISQFDFLMKKDLGYNRENVLMVSIPDNQGPRVEVLRNELLKHPRISQVAFANGIPINWAHEVKVRGEGISKENALNMKGYWVTYDFIELFKMKIVQGRSFSREFQDKDNFVISQAAAKELGWENPLGKSLSVTDPRNKSGTVIGVVEDFHFNNLFFPISPNILILEPRWIYRMYIRVQDANSTGIIDYIRTTWQHILPDVPFEYSTLDHIFTESYRSMIKSAETFKLVSIIAIFISCLGLIGLSSYTIERKTKEIVIRKTLGASVFQIIRLFVAEFIRLVIMANLVALPIAYFISSWFLNWAWAYRIKLGMIYFIIAALLSLVSAFISIIPQTLRAATANPAKSLKYE
jgi:putative ABC transport system permease protein